MITVAFTGDVSFSGKFKDMHNKDFVDIKITQFLNDADYVVANIESPVTSSEINSDRIFNHVSSPESVDKIMELNANVWNLSNNHILDCGEIGVFDTLDIANQYRCMTIGVGKNLDEASKPLVLGSEEKVGLISVLKPWSHTKKSNMVITWDKEDVIKKRIAELKKSVKWIVLVVHGGEEFSSMPMPMARKQYLKFLDWGVNVVVAHHPHVVQNYEIVGEKMIFYSLGNFIFDTDNQRNYKHTENGILLKLLFDDDGMKWEYMPTQIDRKKQKVVEGYQLPIFTNISGWDYKVLWPVAAKQYVKNEDYKKRHNFPEFKNMSDAEWLFYKLKRCRRKRDLLLVIGYILGSMGVGFLSHLKDVHRYLVDK